VIGVDVIGIGASAFDFLEGQGARPINFGAGTDEKDKSGQLQFANVRAAAHWKLREALDPASGENICLPDDPELIADLSAPRWELRGGRIALKSKDEIKDRLGRSPDCGDAVVLAWWARGSGVSMLEWLQERYGEKEAEDDK